MELLLTKENALIALATLGIIVLISYGIGYFKGKNRKKREENVGEAAVRKLLTNYCRKTTAHLLNDITLKYGDGTTQIGHILLTQNGILVIETKHYSGWLFVN